MTEGLFFALQLLAMLLVLRAVYQEGRAGRKPDLGVFAYREDLSQDQQAPGRRPGA